MKKDLIETFTIAIICLILMFFGIRGLVLSHKSNTFEVYPKPTVAVKHERRKNVYHDKGKTTEVFSHTIRYGDTMTIEIDTFIFR
jgi:hypothetical protein